MALLFSALPEWSTTLWYVNMTVAFLASIIMIFSWYTMKNSKRYFSIMSYWLLFTMAFCIAQPIIRSFYEIDHLLWIWLIIIWISFFLLTTILKEKIFQMFHKPFQTKGGITFHILLLILFILVPIVIFAGKRGWTAFKEIPGPFLAAGSVLYVLSLILVFMIPAFLKKPEDIEE